MSEYVIVTLKTEIARLKLKKTELQARLKAAGQEMTAARVDEEKIDQAIADLQAVVTSMERPVA